MAPLLVALAAMVCLGRVAFAQPPEATALTAEAVRKSIERGAQFIKDQQQPDGAWPDRPGYAGGLTPLSTLALLHAGCPPDDPAVAKALLVLVKMAPNSTYTTSLQTMVFCAADAKQYRHLIARNVEWLAGRQHKKGGRSGMWAISEPGSPDHTDNSMTHLAMLALYDAERVGVAVDETTWRLALSYWQRSQNPDGSWGWGPGYAGTGSMTCGGIAAITIAQGRLGLGDATVRDNGVNCCAAQTPNEHLDKAIAWLGNNFAISRNPGSPYWLSYYLYSLERAGRLTGRRFFGDHDWYRAGAKMLIETQFLSGGWPTDIDEEYAGDPNVATAFSLMFLSKGRRPIVLAHLQHGADSDWNRHRGAPLNLVVRTERAWERELAHQAVNIANATVDELLESPVLLITGRDRPNLDATQKQKLRQYVDRGGFLFAVRSCAAGGFDQGLRELIQELFPAAGGLKLLPANHPVWRAETPVDPLLVGELWALDSACRTSVLYAPRDLTCWWELADVGRDDALPPELRAQREAAVNAGVNVLSYATNREVKYKDPGAPEPLAAAPAAEFERGKLYVANVQHNGGSLAAPSALGNWLSVAAGKYRLPVDAQPRQVRLTDEALFQYHLIVLHGTTRFSFTAAEREQLRNFLVNGGVLFADAVCSSKEFTAALRTELLAIFPNRALEAIPESDPLLTPEFGGEDLRQVERRVPFAKSGDKPAVEKISGPPRLEGIRLEDRYAVIFSPIDLSCALDGPEPTGCEGYSRLDAGRIAMNVLLYSLHK